LEIATKWRLGKLPGAGVVVESFQRAIDGLGAIECPILSSESLLAGSWNVPRRDPFDRILAAQAALRDLTLATTDGAFHQFEGVRLFGG
jgi:PIN domain nuclease of toxin-antitoxin system